jgi:hypothetical protein
MVGHGFVSTAFGASMEFAVTSGIRLFFRGYWLEVERQLPGTPALPVRTLGCVR